MEETRFEHWCYVHRRSLAIWLLGAAMALYLCGSQAGWW